MWAFTQRSISAAGTPFRLRLVSHDPEAYRLFYGVVSNPVLWFVQHGLWSLKHDPDADLTVPWRDGYVVANRALAEAAVEELDRAPGAWHDGAEVMRPDDPEDCPTFTCRPPPPSAGAPARPDEPASSSTAPAGDDDDGPITDVDDGPPTFSIGPGGTRGSCSAAAVGV